MNLQFVEQDLGSKFCYGVWTEHKQRRIGEIVFDVSCGWVYVTEEDNDVYFTSPFLRAIAEKLDELNASLFGEYDAKV